MNQNYFLGISVQTKEHHSGEAANTGDHAWEWAHGSGSMAGQLGGAGAA
jgi:hypothetical protein